MRIDFPTFDGRPELKAFNTLVGANDWRFMSAYVRARDGTVRPIVDIVCFGLVSPHGFKRRLRDKVLQIHSYSFPRGRETHVLVPQTSFAMASAPNSTPGKGELESDDAMQNPADMTAFKYKMETDLKAICSKPDEMGTRIDELEQSINELKAEMGPEIPAKKPEDSKPSDSPS
ncbi:hypothetical protein AXF42_Ash003766 [Apostasia shenzhenica]|uniref:Uncharacterized protein n=1 Tax=Apostasia shenzhenica TaxID=1088818 RepID=A0A2I0AHU1_9ASPA|nr:hypothetical protein AXF42_Ash003766 [Apostasia shenzhenica]